VGGAWVTPTRTGVRSLGSGLVWIAPSSRTYPEWYRHGALAWGWTDRGVPLGHDLGGEGWGLRITGFEARGEDEMEARLLVTRRGDENLLAPAARGWGVELRSEGRVGLGAWGNGRVQAAWHLEIGRLGGHGVVAAGLSALYRF
ncbi:MAG TPA: hypothetical protein VLL48_02250, partial [Longimicrobiales bacterium]|nr:hypothetical protein [Longimicrobiales bacterium]